MIRKTYEILSSCNCIRILYEINRMESWCKNDLPSELIIYDKFTITLWNMKFINHRSNDLFSRILFSNSYQYYKYDRPYRYNGYSIIMFDINKFDRSVKFNNGICINWLKMDLDNI